MSPRTSDRYPQWWPVLVERVGRLPRPLGQWGVFVQEKQGLWLCEHATRADLVRLLSAVLPNEQMPRAILEHMLQGLAEKIDELPFLVLPDDAETIELRFFPELPEVLSPLGVLPS